MLLMTLSATLMMTSFMFTRLRHPLTMGITLITQTALICLASGLMSQSLWMSYILFLVFLGATLVLFIYVTSLASNETFKLSYPLSVAVILFPVAISSITPIVDHLLVNAKLMVYPSSLSGTEISDNPTFALAAIYNPPSSFTTSFIILYILMTLIVIVKMTTASTAPLRLLS